MKKKSQKAARPAGRKSGAKSSNLLLEQVQELIELFEQRGLEEFELERPGVRIRLRRRTNAPGPAPAHLIEPFQASTNSGTAAPAATPVAPPAAERVAEGELHIVKSPIVGTFYAATAPDTAPFVKLGDQVEVGQVVCIIEAMKLMNEIEADVAGEIVRIYTENAQPVEYGESLFAIRPARKK